MIAPANWICHLLDDIVLAEREDGHEVCAVLQRLSRVAPPVAQRESEAARTRIEHLVNAANNDNRRLTAACAMIAASTRVLRVR